MNAIDWPSVLRIFAELFSPKLVRHWLQSQNSQPEGKRRRGFYQRIFSLPVTLWYLVFQRLNSDKTQDCSPQPSFVGEEVKRGRSRSWS